NLNDEIIGQAAGKLAAKRIAVLPLTAARLPSARPLSAETRVASLVPSTSLFRWLTMGRDCQKDQIFSSVAAEHHIIDLQLFAELSHRLTAASLATTRPCDPAHAPSPRL
ncbi:hypothetical protein T310_8888, partial [Rasamsonia emersonii CBS 393.64]